MSEARVQTLPLKNREAQLRERAAESSQRWQPPAHLKKFTMVGAHPLDLEKDSSFDAWRFQRLINYLINTGLPVSPDFEIEAVNIWQGRDYLRDALNNPGKLESDVTFISYVLGSEKTIKASIKVDANLKEPEPFRIAQQIVTRRDQGKHDDMLIMAGNTSRWVSPDSAPQAWRDRLALSQSKLIFSVHSCFEVDLDDLHQIGLQKNYDTLGDKEYYDHVRCPAVLSDIGRDDRGDWQVLGRKDYVEQAGMMANSKTGLGRAIAGSINFAPDADENMASVPATRQKRPLRIATRT